MNAISTPSAISPTKQRLHELKNGIRDTLPLMIGAMPFGLIFGAVAIINGLSPAAAIGMSAFVFAGSSQFIGAGLYGAGASLPVIVMTTFVVNLRHALYSATLGPYLKHLPQRWLVALGFWLTDETFVVVVRRYENSDPSPYKHWYHLGSSLGMYINWQVFTIIGIVAGQNIPDPQAWGLDFAMTVTFIGMLIPMLKNRSTVIAVIVSSVVALLANGLPNQLGLMVAALIGVVTGLAAKRYFKETDPAPVTTPAEVTA